MGKKMKKQDHKDWPKERNKIRLSLSERCVGYSLANTKDQVHRPIENTRGAQEGCQYGKGKEDYFHKSDGDEISDEAPNWISIEIKENEVRDRSN